MQRIERPNNRAWLGEFLRSRRARLSPTEHRFPVMGRRRSPALSRDKVAQRAGIPIAYTLGSWIEQGHDNKMSADVLNAIARVAPKCLNEAEHAHLFTPVANETAETHGPRGSHSPTIASLAAVPAYARSAAIRGLTCTRQRPWPPQSSAFGPDTISN